MISIPVARSNRLKSSENACKLPKPLGVAKVATATDGPTELTHARVTRRHRQLQICATHLCGSFFCFLVVVFFLCGGGGGVGFRRRRRLHRHPTVDRRGGRGLPPVRQLAVHLSRALGHGTARIGKCWGAREVGGERRALAFWRCVPVAMSSFIPHFCRAVWREWHWICWLGRNGVRRGQRGSRWGGGDGLWHGNGIDVSRLLAHCESLHTVRRKAQSASNVPTLKSSPTD